MAYRAPRTVKQPSQSEVNDHLWNPSLELVRGFVRPGVEHISLTTASHPSLASRPRLFEVSDDEGEIVTAELDAGLAWDLLQRYHDPASEQFDAVLAAAGVDSDTARALRFWQRESVANVKHYAAQALPAVLNALTTAATDTREATDRAADAWADAHPAVRRDPGLVVVLPEPAPPDPIAPQPPELREKRRRTVAARLTQLG